MSIGVDPSRRKRTHKKDHHCGNLAVADSAPHGAFDCCDLPAPCGAIRASNLNVLALGSRCLASTYFASSGSMGTHNSIFTGQRNDPSHGAPYRHARPTAAGTIAGHMMFAGFTVMEFDAAAHRAQRG